MTVSWTQTPGEIIYFEGAVPDFVLTTQDGVVQGPTRSKEEWTWESLPSGTYSFQAGLYPCSGGNSCEPLGASADTCSDELVVDGEVRVHVRLSTGRVCSISDLTSLLSESADSQTWASETGFQGHRPRAYVLASGRIAYPHVGLTTWSTCAFEVERVRRVSDSLMRVVGQESTTKCSSQVKRRVLSERLTRHEARDGVEQVVVVGRAPRFVVHAVVEHFLS